MGDCDAAMALLLPLRLQRVQEPPPQHVLAGSPKRSGIRISSQAELFGKIRQSNSIIRSINMAGSPDWMGGDSLSKA